jgi:hypothetical protein
MPGDCDRRVRKPADSAFKADRPNELGKTPGARIGEQHILDVTSSGIGGMNVPARQYPPRTAMPRGRPKIVGHLVRLTGIWLA